jgi:hypothetical protein
VVFNTGGFRSPSCRPEPNSARPRVYEVLIERKWVIGGKGQFKERATDKENIETTTDKETIETTTVSEDVFEGCPLLQGHGDLCRLPKVLQRPEIKPTVSDKRLL